MEQVLDINAEKILKIFLNKFWQIIGASGGGGGGGGGGSAGTSPSLIGSGSTSSRLPLNSGFNSMYTSIPQSIGSIADNYR